MSIYLRRDGQITSMDSVTGAERIVVPEWVADEPVPFVRNAETFWNEPPKRRLMRHTYRMAGQHEDGSTIYDYVNTEAGETMAEIDARIRARRWA
jgi:hypothetical protein